MNRQENTAHSGRYEPPGRAPVTPTTFNPFAALGTHPDVTLGELHDAMKRAMKHRHEAVVLRFPATAKAFPSQLQINMAHDWLQTPGQLEVARDRWASKHTAIFHPYLPVGDPGVFTPSTPLQPQTSSTHPPHARTPARGTTQRGRGAAARGAGGGSGRARGGRGGRKNATSSRGGPPQSTARAPATGPGSAEEPIDIDEGPSRSPGWSEYSYISPSDEEGIDDNGIPEMRRESREYRFTWISDDEKPGSSGGAANREGPGGWNNGERGGGLGMRGAGRGVRRPNPQRRRGDGRGSGPGRLGHMQNHRGRSGGNANRNIRVENPVTNDRIRVGEWTGSHGAARNVVVAGFDEAGRIYYRITKLDVWGTMVGAPGSTAVSFEEIDFRPPYRGLDHNAVRMAVDMHLHMPPAQRP